ncbi:MAG: HU family DNA-binding protein [Candidatus Asgardarchaeia archaeon]
MHYVSQEDRMNKGELRAQVAGKVGIIKKDAANVIDAFIDTITNCLSKGEKVTLVGFGTFREMERKARRLIYVRVVEKSWSVS